MNTYTISQELNAHNIKNYTTPESISIEPQTGDWLPEVRITQDGAILVTATRESTGEVFPAALLNTPANEVDVIQQVEYILSFNR